MKNPELESFIAFVKAELGETINESGTLLYSSYTTLRKGKYFILGLNPGGDPTEIKSTILDSISIFKDEKYNAYFQDDWNNGNRLQNNLHKIAEVLNTSLSDICATNLLFTRTKNDLDINWDSLSKFLPVIDKIIEIVSPEVIITFGKVPYSYLQKYFRSRGYFINELEDEPSGHGTWLIRNFEAKSIDRVKVIGLPHLSRYTIYNKEKQLNWLINRVGGVDYTKDCLLP